MEATDAHTPGLSTSAPTAGDDVNRTDVPRGNSAQGSKPSEEITEWITASLESLDILREHNWFSRILRSDISERTSSNDGGSPLPYDVFEVIAEHLVKVQGNFGWSFYFGRSTLARLNRVSKALHEVTLPLLYAKTEYKTEAAFVKSVSRGTPKGWIHTRSLYLSETTCGLLQHHQRFTLDQFGILGKDMDLRFSFPRVELISVAANQEDPTFSRSDISDVLSNTIHLELLEPVALDTLQDRYFDYLDGRKVRTICLFGMEIGNPAAKRRPLSTGNINRLVIREGARIEMPAVELASLFKANSFELPSSSEFALELQQAEPDQYTTPLCQLILEAAKRKALCNLDFRNIHTPAPVLKIKCYPSMLDSFLQVFASAQPLALALEIDLLGPDTPDYIMQGYVESFADIYERHWTYGDWDRSYGSFVQIKSEIPVPEALSNFDHDGDDIRIEVTGVLRGGHSNEDGHSDIGFTASTHTNILLHGRESHRAWRDWSRHYPCPHVPVPEH